MIWYDKSWFQIMHSWFNLISYDLTWYMIGASSCDKSHDDLSLRHGKLTNNVGRYVKVNRFCCVSGGPKGRGHASWCDWETRWSLVDSPLDCLKHGRSDWPWYIIWYVCEFPVSETEILMWLVTCTGTYHVLSYR